MIGKEFVDGTLPTPQEICSKQLFKAIDEIVEMRNSGRPVLVGTTSVEISELISKMLNMRKIPHQVLNAKLHKKEADIVAEAGRSTKGMAEIVGEDGTKHFEERMLGAVTIATNMAGRGTDIKLTPEVKAAGGLAIIGTERHESRRVDRQLRGRSGHRHDRSYNLHENRLAENLRGGARPGCRRYRRYLRQGVSARQAALLQDRSQRAGRP